MNYSKHREKNPTIYFDVIVKETFFFKFQMSRLIKKTMLRLKGQEQIHS